MSRRLSKYSQATASIGATLSAQLLPWSSACIRCHRVALSAARDCAVLAAAMRELQVLLIVCGQTSLGSILKQCSM